MTTAFELGCLSAVKKAEEGALSELFKGIPLGTPAHWTHTRRSDGERSVIEDLGSKHTPTIRSPRYGFYSHDQYEYKNPRPNPLHPAQSYLLRDADNSSAKLQRQRKRELEDKEFAQEQLAQEQPPQEQQAQPNSKSLLSHLKNPYVLGGLGAGALGLGGYAAYKAYQGSKKKKKPASE
jgi:hypothetical protein